MSLTTYVNPIVYTLKKNIIMIEQFHTKEYLTLPAPLLNWTGEIVCMKEKENFRMNNEHSTVNSAKNWQIGLFAFNNGATNAYMILTSYIAYYANGLLGLFLLFVTMLVTGMRIFDGFIDPIIGLMIDKTHGRFGKFRPWMIVGNGMLAISAILMYGVTRFIPDTSMWLRYTLFFVAYVIYALGYTLQSACTKSGQTCLTNDPKQRPTFTLFNMVSTLVVMASLQVVATLIGSKYGYASYEFFNIVVPMVVTMSIVATGMAVVGIWQKDRPEFYGIAGSHEEAKAKDYIGILTKNKPLMALIVAGASSKLCFTIATQTAVACMLYSSMMGNYSGLFLPIYAFCYVMSAPFFALSIKTAQKHGQKKALSRYTLIALIFHVGVLVVLAFWKEGDPSTILSLTNPNLYTIVFLIFYGIGYGAYYCTADMVIPMTADCSDYETYRTGKYVPGMVGTLFGMCDKLVSALGTTVVGVAVMTLGLKTLPDINTPYIPGMKWLVIILFCIIPMLSFVVTLIAMKHYSLSGDRMEEIQEVNSARKKAIANGMDPQEALVKWPFIEDKVRKLSTK